MSWRHRLDVDEAWHAAMMAEGPQGAMRKHGVRSWDDLRGACVDFMAQWERWPEPIRRNYAFPNPEDR